MGHIPSYQEYPGDEPIPRFVIENMLTETVSKAINTYDAIVSQPKHEENQKALKDFKETAAGHFKDLHEGQQKMLDILNQVEGAVKVFVCLAFVLTVVGLILKIRHGG